MGDHAEGGSSGDRREEASRSARLAALPPSKRALLAELSRRSTAAAASHDRLGEVILLRAGELSAGDPVILAHPIGGSLFCYVELCRALSGGRAIWGVAAGTALSQPHEVTVERLAEHYVALLNGVGVSRAAALAGWSFGGLLAYEMARQWGRFADAAPPAVLIDSAPWPADVAPWDQETTLRTFAEYLLQLTGSSPDDAPLDAGIWRRPVRDALGCAAVRLRELGIDLGFSADELAERYWMYANLAAAMSRYQPGNYAGSVVLVQTHDSSSLPARWASAVRGSVTVEEVPGDHYGVLRPPVVERVALALGQAARSGAAHSD